MKLMMVLFLVAITNSIASEAYSQNTKLTMQIKDATVKEVLSQIETNSEFFFLYNSKLVDVDRKVSMDVDDEKINEILNDLFGETDVVYAVVDRQIVLTNKANQISFVQPGSQQPQRITGTVTDKEGSPLPGVNVVVTGTTQGTITDIAGKYSIEVPPGLKSLTFTFVGMEIQEITIGTLTQINVTMAESAIGLEEVVVVGYGTQKKVNLTGAVSAIIMDDVLGDRPVTNVATALQGVIPGVTISGSFAPGVEKSFNIRGYTSITGGSPLILVDNVPTLNLNMINPEDIESVSVLKDASSAAIYGARAAFGVILIKTKEAKRNQKTEIKYSNSFAFEKVTNIPKPASPMETVLGLKDMGYQSYWSGQNIDIWLDLLNEYKTNPSKYPLGWTEIEGNKYFLKQTDLIGDMLANYGFKQTHNISASGGSEVISYRLSTGFTDEDGILITNKDGFKRMNVSSYVNADISKWLSTSLDIKFGKNTRTYPNSGIFNDYWKNYLPSYHPDDVLPIEGVDYPVQTIQHAIEYASKQSWVNDDSRIFSRTLLTPLKGLEMAFEYFYEKNNLNQKRYNNYFILDQGLQDALNPSDQNTEYYVNKIFEAYSTINAYATYKTDLEDLHHFTITAGFNQEFQDKDQQWSKNYLMISNELPSLSGGTGIQETGDSFDQFALRSGFYRFNYNYKDKYLLESNGRYDGSSKFPTNTRFGFFPSLSIGWNIANEDFMSSVKSINTLKLRASYGSLGNQAIDNYGYVAAMSPIQANWIYDGLQPIALTTPGLVRANYRWEVVETFNLGLDCNILNSRLQGTFDIYQRNTIGMLAPGMELPAVAGTSAPLQNAADLKTNGWELELSWKDQIGQWRYGIGFNLFDSKTIIIKYRNENKVLDNYYEGMEIGEIWGYVSDGFYTENDFNANGTLKDEVVSINGVISHPGDVKFKNLLDNKTSVNIIDTGEGTLNDPGDLKVIGNNRARFNFGVNGFLNWKNLSMSYIFQGVAKRDAWIGGNLMFPHAGYFSTFYEYQLDYWTPENTNAYYGRIYANAQEAHSVNQRTQTKYLQNASYVRLKNLTIGYNLPNKLSNKIGLTGIKIFFSGENLFTLSNLIPGVDPETLSWNYPLSSMYSFGIIINL